MFDKLSKWVANLYYSQQRKPDEPEITYQKSDAVKITPVPDIWVNLPEGKKVNINKLAKEGNFTRSIRKQIFLFDDYKKCGFECSSFDLSEIDVNKWTSPMMELFQLFRRDYDNIVIQRASTGSNRNVTIEHKLLGLKIETIDYSARVGTQFMFINHNTGLELDELMEVIVTCELFSSTKEYQRYLRIKSLSDIRALELAKTLEEQEKVNYRNAQTNRIKEYLNANK